MINKKASISPLMMIVLLALLIFQVIFFFVIIKDLEVYKTEPLIYAANKYDITDCICQITSDKYIHFNKSDSITIIKNIPQKYEFDLEWDNKK